MIICCTFSTIDFLICFCLCYYESRVDWLGINGLSKTKISMTITLLFVVTFSNKEHCFIGHKCSPENIQKIPVRRYSVFILLKVPCFVQNISTPIHHKHSLSNARELWIIRQNIWTKLTSYRLTLIVVEQQFCYSSTKQFLLSDQQHLFSHVSFFQVAIT